MTRLQGCGTALVTPFTESGQVDFAALRALVDWQIAEGIDFLVACGSTGEAQTLDEAERERVVAAVVEVAAGRVPVMAGATSNDTSRAVHETGRMCSLGADYILSATPYYNKPTQEGLYQHYRAFAESTPLPIIVYNVPGRTGVNVEVATLARLAQIPNIVGVKEASGNVPQMCEICRAVPEDFIVLSGDDALTLPLMAIGGHGIISVASNEIPAEMVQMVEIAERNDFAAARKVHARMLPLMSVNFIESNPGPVKAAMAAMGLIEETYRLPMVSPKAESKQKIVQVLKELGLLKAAFV